VPAGFVFNDPLVLPARTATNYVTIRVADLSALPANKRVTGSAADRAKLFRMDMHGTWKSGYNNGVEMSLGAHYYRIIGLEIRHQASEVNADMIGNGYDPIGALTTAILFLTAVCSTATDLIRAKAQF
jgi:hypothetical protein